MLKFFGNSLLIFIIVISLAVILGTLFYFTYSEIERSAKEVALGEIQNVSETQTHDSGKIIENALMDIVTNLKTIANSPTVIRQSNNTNDVTLLLKAGQSSTNNITDYYRIIDKNGKMITSSSSNSNSNSNLDTSNDKNFNKQNFSNSSYFVMPKETHKLYISDLIYPIIKNPRFSISTPILTNDTTKIFSNSTVNDKSVPNDNKIIFNGIIEASIRADKLKGFVEYSMLSSQINDITLLDRKGVVMFNINEDLIGKEFFSPQVQSLLFNQLPIKELENINKLVYDALNGKSGSYNLNATKKTSTFSSKPISLAGDQFMTLLLNKPYSLDAEVISFLTLQRNFSIITIFIIVVVSAILGYFLSTWNKRLQTQVNNQTNKLNQNVEQLRKANEQLKQHDKTQKEFLNITAHELRTPIQSIMGYTQMIKSFPEKTTTYIQPIERNAERLYKLIQDILDITKIESGTLKLKKTTFDMNEKINNVIRDLTPKKNLNDDNSTNQNVKFIFQPTKEPIMVFSDKERIYQVISNLIKNALKFIPSNDGTIEIMLEKVNDKDKNDNKKEFVSVKIRDNGTGIDPEILPKLFSKFSTKSEYGGTGLGLYISKKIIETHGGTIKGYNNFDGNGATFEFLLPLN